MRRIIIIGLALIVFAGLILWKFAPNFSKPGIKTASNEPIELTVWGLWEDESLMRVLTDEYKKTHPSVKINYVHQSSQNYRTRVQTQILNKQGPDIFMIHNSWLPMLQKTQALAEAPEQLMSVTEFSKIFYPVAKDSFIKNGKIYALPLEVDGLALFYNEDILRAANVGVPQTWDQFITASAKMTVKDATGNIKTAGAAMGTTNNVDHWSDILGLLFYQQPGVSFENIATPQAGEILRFYTNFVKDPNQKVWDASMESSTQAFYSGRLGFYFAPSWRAYDLRVANPQLKFKTAPVPQLPGGNIGWGTFWGFAVAKSSAHQAQSWEFLKFLTAKESEKLLYQTASQTRLFGQPYSRIDLRDELTKDPIVGAFVNQAPVYKFWYLSSKTGDQGINDEMIKYFEDALNAVSGNSDPVEALKTAALGVKQVLDKYSPSTPAPAK